MKATATEGEGRLHVIGVARQAIHRAKQDVVDWDLVVDVLNRVDMSEKEGAAFYRILSKG